VKASPWTGRRHANTVDQMVDVKISPARKTMAVAVYALMSTVPSLNSRGCQPVASPSSCQSPASQHKGRRKTASGRQPAGDSQPVNQSDITVTMQGHTRSGHPPVIGSWSSRMLTTGSNPCTVSPMAVVAGCCGGQGLSVAASWSWQHESCIKALQAVHADAGDGHKRCTQAAVAGGWAQTVNEQVRTIRSRVQSAATRVQSAAMPTACGLQGNMHGE